MLAVYALREEVSKSKKEERKAADPNVFFGNKSKKDKNICRFI